MDELKAKLKAYGMQILIGFIAIIGGYLGNKLNPPAPIIPPITITPPAPVAPVEPTPQPLKAIGKIQLGSYGCTGTVIGPRHSDGTYDVLTAGHCIPPTTSSGLMVLDSGKQFGIHVMARDTKADCCWMRTVTDVGELPFALIADDLPVKGEDCWHAGYGVEQPRNRENGKVVEPTNGSGQTQYFISVSSGDSGGGIICDKTGRVLSSVCCTTAKGVKADVWGCSVKAIRNLRPVATVNSFEWTPIPIPTMGD